jgi:signal transduction histidine kinase
MKRRSAQEYQAGLERCLADSMRLESLVADMLTLARAESSSPATAPEPTTDLTACINQAVTQLETLATLRSVQVHLKGTGFSVKETDFSVKGTGFSAKETGFSVKGTGFSAKETGFSVKGTGFSPYIDPVESVGALAPEGIQLPIAPEDCGLLVCNLLLNALQHSPSGSIVEITLAVESNQTQSTAVLQIQDHGDGIPAEALPHVFDRFYRGDPSRTRTTGGTGLGLSISKAIVTRAGGSISIASQPDPTQANQGTTVTVRLPILN